jgi:putative transposase
MNNDNEKIKVQIPRDRNSTFEPVILPKHEIGMNCRDIQRHLLQVYGVDVSPELISNVTASVMADVKEWQTRPLEKSYPILFLDALRVNTRQDGRNINKALYVALVVNREGRKEVLGLWLSDNEGAKF